MSEKRTTNVEPKYLQMIEKSFAGHKYSIAKLISLFENSNPDSFPLRTQLIQFLETRKASAKRGFVVGFTGTPGAGKSSLIGEICLQLLQKSASISIAVLAVDPSSQVSGGAILGDRTRVHFPLKEKRIFFRSQASNLELGGVSQKTFQAVRILRYFFDFILIETVGIGQSEIEIQHVSDHTCLVLQPLTGDQIQFIKCGIMEIPNTFIINKCDEEGLAHQSFHLLTSSLQVANLYADSDQPPPIFLTSALQRIGIENIADFILTLSEQPRRTFAQKEEYYLQKWLQTEYGNWGMQKYQEMKQHREFSALQGYEEKISGWNTYLSTNARK